MTVQQIVDHVRSAIDELMQNDSEFLRKSNDELNLTDIIIDKIGYALQYVIENAPLDKLTSDMFVQTTPTATITSTTAPAEVEIANDVLRIIEARLSSWTYAPVPVTANSQVALMQTDTYAMGSYDRPVSVLAFKNQKRYLYMYCPRETTDTAYLTVIKKPSQTAYTSADLASDVTVPSQLEAALVYQIAGIAMTAFREDIAGQLFAISQRYLGYEPNNMT